MLGYVRSGWVDLPTTAGTFWGAGRTAGDWSSRGDNTIWRSAGLGGYYLYFDTTGVNPSYGPTSRYVGFPLRCLSTVPGM